MSVIQSVFRLEKSFLRDLATYVLMPTLFLLASINARAQDLVQNTEPAKACNHGGYDFWDAIKMLPVRFTAFNSDSVAWQYQDDYKVKVGSFVFYEKAAFVSREQKELTVSYAKQQKNAHWLCYYCSRCNKLLRAYELLNGTP